MSIQRYVADELTHFVGRQLGSDDDRYGLLVKILTTGWLIAPGTTNEDGSPTEDKISRRYSWSKKVSDAEGLFSVSAVCFCDIPVADLGLHVQKYSRFGLAFSKTFLIAKGTAPVFYVPRGVQLFGQSRAEALDSLIDELKRMHPGPPQGPGALSWRPPELSTLEKFVEDLVLAFVKPFDETRPESDPANYYMEREWRTLTSVAFRIGDVRRVILPEDYRTRLRENVPMFTGQVHFVQ